jgi:hypothetical protein
MPFLPKRIAALFIWLPTDIKNIFGNQPSLKEKNRLFPDQFFHFTY